MAGATPSAQREIIGPLFHVEAPALLARYRHIRVQCRTRAPAIYARDIPHLALRCEVLTGHVLLDPDAHVPIRVQWKPVPSSMCSAKKVHGILEGVSR